MATPEPFHTPRALPFPVHVHPIPPTNPKTYAYERRHSNSAHCDNALVFIGGLGSGPHTTHYLGPLNDALESASLKGEDGVKYGLWELRMRSSYTAFGYGSLKDDVEDVRELVVYLKALGIKAVVLVGSSSGELDVLLVCLWYMLLVYVLWVLICGKGVRLS
jgi:pimeloyl-ACP methyl ester carboxylesterase